MIPKKLPNKNDIKRVKEMDTVAFIMGKYLNKFEVAGGKEQEFCEKFWSKLIDKAINEPVRVILPHNLGYLQVLEHQYETVSIPREQQRRHLEKFGNVDYSLVWIKHPMFCHHRLKTSKRTKEIVLQNKLKGMNYLSEYVDGDAYVA